MDRPASIAQQPMGFDKRIGRRIGSENQFFHTSAHLADLPPSRIIRPKQKLPPIADRACTIQQLKTPGRAAIAFRLSIQGRFPVK
jgi:hypothetical protein